METLFGKIFLLWAGFFVLAEVGVKLFILLLRGLERFESTQLSYHDQPTKYTTEPRFTIKGKSFIIVRRFHLLLAVMSLIGTYFFLFGEWQDFLWAGIGVHLSVGLVFWIPSIQKGWEWKWILRMAATQTVALSLICEVLFSSNNLLRVVELLGLVFVLRYAHKTWKSLRSSNDRFYARTVLGTVVLFSALY